MTGSTEPPSVTTVMAGDTTTTTQASAAAAAAVVSEMKNFCPVSNLVHCSLLKFVSSFITSRLVSRLHHLGQI